jgi:hypothetical protein
MYQMTLKFLGAKNRVCLPALSGSFCLQISGYYLSLRFQCRQSPWLLANSQRTLTLCLTMHPARTKVQKKVLAAAPVLLPKSEC